MPCGFRRCKRPAASGVLGAPRAAEDREQVREQLSGTQVAPVVPNAEPLQPLLEPTRYGSKTVAASGNGGAPTDRTNGAKKLAR